MNKQVFVRWLRRRYPGFASHITRAGLGQTGIVGVDDPNVDVSGSWVDRIRELADVYFDIQDQQARREIERELARVSVTQTGGGGVPTSPGFQFGGQSTWMLLGAGLLLIIFLQQRQ